MNILLEIFNELFLNESVSTNSVTDAIKNRYRVTINYEGDPKHGVAPGMRTVEVYTYGLSKAGNPVIRAYQPYGDTASKVPDWKFFRLDRITSWQPTYALFNRSAPKFNPKGDKTMSVVYTIADFSKKPDTDNLTGPKQRYKPIGQLPNIDKALSDRKKEKSGRKEQERAAITPRLNIKKNIETIKKSQEPKISGEEELKIQKIPEPEINISDKITTEPQVQPQEMETMPVETPKPEDKNKIMTAGDEQLEKIKDLNRRLDNARKIDLSQIPKK